MTVRTLHHYEEIGLLVASTRSAAGHRRYGRAEVERLYRISLLRRLGLSLGEIATALDDPKWDLGTTMDLHLNELERRLDAETRLRRRLTRLAAAAPTSPVPVEDLLHILEDMTMTDTIVRRRLSILVYQDLEEAFAFLVRVFGLGPGTLTRDEAGRVVHGELEAGDGAVWLHPESPEFGLASPRTLGATTSTMAVMVDDVDAHHRHAAQEGASIDYEPVDQPYGFREYSARDSEGGLWSFMRQLDA